MVLAAALGTTSTPSTASPGAPDSILATARVLSGETGLGPASRVARRPATRVYAEYLRDRLAARVAAWGGAAFLEAFDPGFDDAPPDSVRSPFTNVVARIPGRLGAAAPGAFLLGAHFDATSQADATSPVWNPLTWDAPGADDNGSGVAAILEALRLLAEGGEQPEADVWVVFFDGEELQPVYDATAGKYVLGDRSRLGSEHLADSLITAGDRLYGVFVADMVAYNPRVDSLVVLTNARSRWLADGLLAAQGDSLETGLARGLEITRVVRGFTFSDHGPFWERDVDGVLLLEAALIDRHAPHYHRQTDRVETAYSRGGSLATKAAEAITALLLTWSRPPAVGPELVVTPEDILVQDSLTVDLSVVAAGKPVEVRVGVTNRGGTQTGSWSVAVDLEDLGGRQLKTLGMESVSETLPAGGRHRTQVSWIPSAQEAGAVKLVARVTPATGTAVLAERVVAVETSSGAVAEAFVFPNPTREPQSAVVRYTLSRGGPVRIEVLDLRAQHVAVWEASYDPIRPGEAVDTGAADVPLGTILGSTELPPGIYLLRIQLYAPEGESSDVVVTRFVVLR